MTSGDQGTDTPVDQPVDRPRPVQPSARGYRYRITFAKTGVLRFVGHLDLQRCIERTLRRARIPLRYTQGYHRRPRLQFAAALPLGQVGRAELLDIWLDVATPADELGTRLEATRPPDLSFTGVDAIGPDAPRLSKLIRAADYTACLSPGAVDDAAGLSDRVVALLAAESLPRERRGKPYDLRPLIERLEVVDQGLSMRLGLGDRRTGRPEEVLLALDLVPEQARIERLRIVLESIDQADPAG